MAFCASSDRLPMDGEDWKYLLRLEEELCCKLNNIDFRMPPSKIVHVYNPIDYAIQLHLSFITRFFTFPKKVLFVGMNPGPFGMAQTGVFNIYKVFRAGIILQFYVWTGALWRCCNLS